MSLPIPESVTAATRSPKPDQEPLASPTMSLPMPAGARASATSPALGPQVQQAAMTGRPASTSHPDADDFQSPPLVTQSRPVAPGHTPLGENNAHGVEVHVLSEIWKVFDQVVRQVRPEATAVAVLHLHLPILPCIQICKAANRQDSLNGCCCDKPSLVGKVMAVLPVN